MGERNIMCVRGPELLGWLAHWLMMRAAVDV